MKKYVYLVVSFLFFSCKSDAELSMERGIQYFDWGKYNQAILEFNKAKYLQIVDGEQSYDNLKLLAQTHYNLAITYANLGRKTLLIDGDLRKPVLHKVLYTPKCYHPNLLLPIIHRMDLHIRNPLHVFWASWLAFQKVRLYAVPWQILEMPLPLQHPNPLLKVSSVLLLGAI